jgi:hypothetical protein
MEQTAKAYLYYGVDICTIWPFDDETDWFIKPKDMSLDAWDNFSIFGQCEELEKYLRSKELCSDIMVSNYGCPEKSTVFLYSVMLATDLRRGKLLTTCPYLELGARDSHSLCLQEALKVLSAPESLYDQIGWYLAAYYAA